MSADDRRAARLGAQALAAAGGDAVLAVALLGECLAEAECALAEALEAGSYGMARGALGLARQDVGKWHVRYGIYGAGSN